MAAAMNLVRMLDELGRVTEEPGRLTRTFLSPAMQQANARVARWMRTAGLKVREDTVGNLIGRLASSNPRAKTLLLGSHLDTVRDAGRFDGALGVLLPIVVLAELQRKKIALPFHVEALGFSEEEGVRFASAYLGSKGYSGKLRADDLRFRDANGVSVREALEKFEQKTLSLPKAAHRARDLLGYVETHIEQGPVLEKAGLAVGVVSAIAGQTRARVTFRGHAGHAGTTPMNLRRDALVAGAELIVFTENLARKTEGLVATVGTATVSPGAPNVVPGAVTLSLDMRHARDSVRRAALARLKMEAKKTSRRRGLELQWEVTQDNRAVACAPRLVAELEGSVRAVQRRSIALVSGAGHDAVVMSALTPVAMLFVRCRKGLSHHPDEFASPADLKAASRVLTDFLQRLAENHR
jgi:allantoate deiminase